MITSGARLAVRLLQRAGLAQVTALMHLSSAAQAAREPERGQGGGALSGRASRHDYVGRQARREAAAARRTRAGECFDASSSARSMSASARPAGAGCVSAGDAPAASAPASAAAASRRRCRASTATTAMPMSSSKLLRAARASAPGHAWRAQPGAQAPRTPL